MASEKFKALVHYVVASVDDPQRLGATRLNKICWYADTIAYRYTGKSISGETYVKRKHGPVPKSILHAIRALETEKKIEVYEQEFLPSRKMRIFASLKAADIGRFEQEEREILDYVAKKICHDHTAASISELSHDMIWEAANDGEEIPLSATLVAEPAQMTPKARAWAEKMVTKFAGRENAA